VVLANERHPRTRQLDNKLFTEKDLTLLPLHEELRGSMLPDHSWNGRQVVIVLLQQPLVQKHLLNFRHWLLLSSALATEVHLVSHWLHWSRLECFPEDWLRWLMNNLVLTILALREVVMGGIGDEIFWNFDALAGYSPQLLRFALIIFAEIVNLANKLLKGLTVGLFGIRSVIGKEQDLILEC
jgi:hypothetical protein